MARLRTGLLRLLLAAWVAGLALTGMPLAQAASTKADVKAPAVKKKQPAKASLRVSSQKKTARPTRLVRAKPAADRLASRRPLAAPGGQYPVQRVSASGFQPETENARMATPDAPATASVMSFSQEQGLHKTPDRLALSTGAALVMDASTHEIIYAKNVSSVLPIASITKLMTALVTLESKPALDETITVTQDDVDTYRNSHSRLRVGDQLSRREMLKIALMSSENRAASALGRHYPGGPEAFVQAMNDKARALGMRQSHFVDATGLSEKNQSSAIDLAKLVAAAQQHPAIREWTTLPNHEVEVGRGRRLAYHNSNPLVRNDAWDILLQKTGYIREAGRCVVMAVSASGKQFVMVLLDSMTPQTRIADAQKLKRYLMSKL